MLIDAVLSLDTTDARSGRRATEVPLVLHLCSSVMDVELRHLRAFVAVAQHLSFTRAAEQLLITQPALTRTVKQLEAVLEVTLLDRDTRRVALTPAGARFLASAEQVLASMDRALASVREEATLRLGFSWLLPDPWAQRAVAAYEEATGNQVALTRIEDPVAALTAGSVDIAVVRNPVPGGGAVRAVHLFDETRVLICSAASELATTEEIGWADLAGQTLVYNRISGTTGPWSWPGGEGPTRFVETDNYDEWLESVAADRGIGVVSEVAMRRTIHPAVRFVPLRDAPPIPVSIAFVLDHQARLKRRFVEAAVAAAGPPDVIRVGRSGSHLV
jgi:DNA-binding transcriptional LysR family regulator